MASGGSSWCRQCGASCYDTCVCPEVRAIREAVQTNQHSGSARFHAILAELGALHDKKQQDYGTTNDPFANVRGSEEWGVEPWVGALIRATDKMRRLQKFARVGKLANEAVEDSFRDLSVYAIIALILYEETHAETESEED